MTPSTGRRPFRARLLAAVAAPLFLAITPTVGETRDELWPEFNAYLKLSPRTRIFLLAAFARAEESESTTGNTIYRDGQFGAHLDLTLKPRLRHRVKERGDWERERYLWARVGYRYGTNIGPVDDPFHEHRGIAELTARLPLPASFWLAGRARVDFRDVDGKHSTRYRSRLTLEREMLVSGTAIAPNVSAEFFYDSRFDEWNRQRYQAGAEVVLNPHWRIEPYLTRQDDRRSQPEHVNALGVAVKYYR